MCLCMVEDHLRIKTLNKNQIQILISFSSLHESTVYSHIDLVLLFSLYYLFIYVLEFFPPMLTPIWCFCVCILYFEFCSSMVFFCSLTE